MVANSVNPNTITHPAFQRLFGVSFRLKMMPTGSAIRVLVVDDEDHQRHVLAEMVAALGFSVTTAADGKEAIETQTKSPADVIVTDLMMPRMDGEGLLRSLQEAGD